jgi:hypothetical protein
MHVGVRGYERCTGPASASSVYRDTLFVERRRSVITQFYIISTYMNSSFAGSSPVPHIGFCIFFTTSDLYQAASLTPLLRSKNPQQHDTSQPNENTHKQGVQSDHSPAPSPPTNPLRVSASPLHWMMREIEARRMGHGGVGDFGSRFDRLAEGEEIGFGAYFTRRLTSRAVSPVAVLKTLPSNYTHMWT